MTVYPQQYPFGAPTVSGNNITVDLMLKEPTRINQYLSDLVLKKFFADRIFNNGGGVSGGALVYTQLTKNDLFATTGVQKVAPGAEFPTVSFDRPEPKVAVVEKWGGKFDVTDEARDRNDLSLIQSEASSSRTPSSSSCTPKPSVSSRLRSPRPVRPCRSPAPRGPTPPR